MDDFPSDVHIALLNQPLAANLTKRRVNFYIAKPKGKSSKKTPTLTEKQDIFTCANLNMPNQNKTAQLCTQKRKYFEIDFKNEAANGHVDAAQFPAVVTENQTNDSFTHYYVKLDKNVDTKVNALIADLDSKGSILLRNSFLCEEPIAWQRCPPFTKKSPKRSLSILSANYLQFDDANKNNQSSKKDLLGFPDPNIALLASVDYSVDMKMLSDLLFSGGSEFYDAYETDSDCDV